VSSPTSGQTTISFTEQDLAVFSEASGDRNPLHLSRERARRSPYGQPVVFGCLGAMACLGQIRFPAGWSAASFEVQFLGPMFLDVIYRIETSQTEGRRVARLFDGTTPVVSVVVTLEPSDRDEMQEAVGSPSAFERRDAAVRLQEDIFPGQQISGTYACNAAALAALAARWGDVDGRLAMVLCTSSYLVGMELPGESAIFSKLMLYFHETARFPAVMVYRVSVASVDLRFGRILMDVSLFSGTSSVASGQFWTYMRRPLSEVEESDFTGVRPDSLAGRVAVLVGSSRGLGAAMKRVLELRGAAVYGMARSTNDGDLSRTEVGDAADPETSRRLRERVSTEHSRLDFLICNASPPILPLRLEPNATARIGAYINLAVAQTLAPLSEFLDLLNQSNGCAVIISSAAVEQPVREWPHYIAAKQAVEALGRVAALQYPCVSTLIVRPQKLLTDLTNTPMGRLGAGSPWLVARRIAARLEDPLEPGKTEILV
jgi:NAD(P)-dependent dehydrogenase (short-subunit alcohol dehydrogenase family)/acyl dehydratase